MTPVEGEAKEFWRSKTFWFGVLWIALGAGNVVLGAFDYVPDSNIEGIAEIVNGALIVILRFVTKVPVSTSIGSG